MNAARIIIGWTNNVYTGETANEIIAKAEQVQDFDCLISMGRSMGSEPEQTEIDKLEKFIELYRNDMLSMEDIKNLNIKLSVGNFRCEGIALSEAEMESL